MKTLVLTLLMLLVLSMALASPQGLPRNPLHVKGNVYYTVRGNRSRVSLLFKGTVQHTETRGEKSLTIDCSGIAGAPSLNGSDRDFKDGLVRHMTVDRITGGITKVVLTLRHGNEKFAVALDSAQGVLRVDLFPNPFAVNSRLAARSAVPGKITRSLPKDFTKKEEAVNQTPPTPIVDLSGLVRNQLTEAIEEKYSSPGESTSKDRRGEMPQSLAAKNAVLWLALACASLVATLIAILVLVKNALRKSNVSRSNELSSSNHQALSLDSRFEEPSFDQGRRNRTLGEPELRARRGFEELESIEDGRSATITLAEQYRRSQGDIELAMKLRDRESPGTNEKKVGVIKAAKMPRKGTLSMAKKNGVGAGELDLAAKLRTLESAFSEKEAAS